MNNKPNRITDLLINITSIWGGKLYKPRSPRKKTT